MTKQKLKSRVKYLRALSVELEELAIATKDGIAKARYNQASNDAKATIGAMVLAWDRASLPNA
jgi:hypothetical protein